MRGHSLHLLLATRVSPHALPCGGDRLPPREAGACDDGDCAPCPGCDACAGAGREEGTPSRALRRAWRMAGYQVHNGRAAGPAVRG